MAQRLGWLFLAFALLYVAFEGVATTAFDFRAFYCAGYAVRLHADPYLTHPLHECEVARTDKTFGAFARAVTLPAPLPGYDIAAFVPFSLLPFAAAKALWTIVLAAAIAAAVFALSRLTEFPATFTFALLWLSLIFPSLAYGELIPVSIGGLCLAVWCAHERRWTGAALGAVAALAEPHIGLPVCLALAIWQPQTRELLIGALTTLAAISLATLGLHENLEYFTRVLPLHAVSEIGSDAQLSLSVILHYNGMSDAAATAFGSLWYAAMVLLGVWSCAHVARRFSDRAYLAALPAALSLLGGTFIHVTDFVAALPLALLLYRDLPRARAAIAGAVLAIALPWWHLALVLHQEGPLAVVPMTAAVAFYIAWTLTRGRTAAACIAACCALAILIGVNHWYVQSSDTYHRAAGPIHVSIDRRYPEASWAWVTQKFISTGTPASWALRAPSWAGILIAAFGALWALRVAARRQEEVRANA